jgi:hypothetical protein
MNTRPELILPNWQRVTSQADGLGESPFWHPVEKRLYWRRQKTLLDTPHPSHYFTVCMIGMISDNVTQFV